MIRSRPFDYPYNGRLDPSVTALLVIDLQVDFLSEDGYFAKKGYDPAPLRKIVPTVAKLVDAARAAGCLIIWTRQGYRSDIADASPYDRWRSKRAGINLGSGHANAMCRSSCGFAIAPEFQVDATDVIVDKTANNAFYQTDLDIILRSQGITHLMFSGCTTDVCVHSTLRDAVDRKYQCLLVEDACASGDEYAHAAAIHMVTVEDGVFGVVARSTEVITELATAAKASVAR